MKKSMSFAIGLMLAGLAFAAAANEVATQHKTLPVQAKAQNAATAKKTKTDPTQEIFRKLSAKFPNTRITSINKSPMKGLYEVAMGKNIAYVDDDVNVFLFGHMFDIASQQDLTQARIDEMTKVDFASLPLDKAIKIVKGNGARVFAVFSDPDCPYCKRLESDLSGVDNYTMYVFLYPITQLHPDAAAHANAIWCAADKAAAWHTFLTTDKLPVVDPKAPKKECASPVDELAKLGQSIGVNGTPTLVRTDGKVMPGAPSGDGLDSFLTAITSGTKLPAQAPASLTNSGNK